MIRTDTDGGGPVGRFRWPAAVLAVGGAAAVGAAFWWRKHPSPLPYGLRYYAEVPHPIISRSRLKRVLEPHPGERILEIGCGSGYYTPSLAEWIGHGRLDIADVQPGMLEHTMRKVRSRGLTNVSSSHASAEGLPYADASFDAVVLTMVIGEVPDADAALREIHRVLKPGGRLIVGELAPADPHFTRLSSVRARAEGAGLEAAGHSGSPVGYFARFTKPV